MKPINVTKIIKNYKGISSSAVLSLLIHISMFLVIPTFSFLAIDKLEDSNGQLLTVEMINVEGKDSEIDGRSDVQESQERKESGEAGKDRKNLAKPSLPQAMDQALVQEERNADVTAKDVENNRIEPSNETSTGLDSHSLQGLPDLSSMEKEANLENHKPEMSGDIEAVPVQLPQANDVQPAERFAEQEDEQGQWAVEKEAAAQPAEKEENVKTTPTEGIKENQMVDEIGSVTEKEGPVAEPEPLTPRHLAQVVEAGEAEIKVEGRKGDIVSEESPEDKEAGDVKEVKAGKSEPVPADIVQPELSVADSPQDLNFAEKRKEPVKSIEQKVGTGEKSIAKDEPPAHKMPVPDKKPEEIKVAEKGKEFVKNIEQKVETEEKSIAKDESPAHKMPVPDKKTEEMKVAEKSAEPADVEQNVESPKKKKRVIPFHKMLEPEKETTIGIPLGRPFIKFTTPAKKKISGRVQSVSGRAQGKGVTMVTLIINGDNTIIPVQNGRFLWETVLKDGKNTISGTVWDTDGKSASDTVTVEVLPTKNGFKLSIDEPGGDIESPVAVVRGSVMDATVDTVRLIVNGELFETAVEGGHFEKTILFKGKENILEAEATNSAGLAARTEPLKVLVKNPLVADILIHLIWNNTETEIHPGLSRKERSHLDDERAAGKDVNMVELMSSAEGYGEKILSVREADGAYTLKVSGGKGTDCKLDVSLNSSVASRKVRVFEKRLMEGEEWVVGRFLMPEGVFWDEDEWFSGRIEGSDSMIKYKSPEGVTWKELK